MNVRDILYSPWVLVGIGGGLGSLARYGIAGQLPGGAIPFNYLVINVTGSLFIGLITALTVEYSLLSGSTRLFLAVGVLGGYTTFSTFTLGLYFLIHGHHLLKAGVYGLSSLILGLAATWTGLIMVRGLVMWRRSPRDERGSGSSNG